MLKEERAGVQGNRLNKERGYKYLREAADSSSPANEIHQQISKHQDPTVPVATKQTQRVSEVSTALESKWEKQG